jgi:hypothetical protein
MLRSIMSAIRSALRSVGRALARLMMFPGQLLGQFFGVPDCDDLPDLAPPEDLSAGLNEPISGPALLATETNLVRMWCADSLIDDRPAPLPDAPIELLEWLQGLTRDECDAIIQADKYSVSEHLLGRNDIVGVRPVGLLPAMQEWPPETESTSPAFSAGAPEPLSTLYATP